MACTRARILDVDDPNVDIGKASLGVKSGHQREPSKRGAEMWVGVCRDNNVGIQSQNVNACLEEEAHVVKLLDPCHILRRQTPSLTSRSELGSCHRRTSVPKVAGVRTGDATLGRHACARRLVEAEEQDMVNIMLVQVRYQVYDHS